MLKKLAFISITIGSVMLHSAQSAAGFDPNSTDGVISTMASIGVASATESTPAGMFAGSLTSFALVNIFDQLEKGKQPSAIQKKLQQITIQLQTIESDIKKLGTVESEEFNAIMFQADYNNYKTAKTIVDGYWKKYTGYKQKIKGTTTIDLIQLACDVTSKKGNTPVGEVMQQLKDMDNMLMSKETQALLELYAISKANEIGMGVLPTKANPNGSPGTPHFLETEYYNALKKAVAKFNIPRYKALILTIESELLLAAAIKRYAPINTGNEICSIVGSTLNYTKNESDPALGSISTLEDICKSSTDKALGNPYNHCKNIPEYINRFFYGHESFEKIKDGTTIGKGLVSQLEHIGAPIGNDSLIPLWYPNQSIGEAYTSKGTGLLFAKGNYVNDIPGTTSYGTNFYTGKYDVLNQEFGYWYEPGMTSSVLYEIVITYPFPTKKMPNARQGLTTLRYATQSDFNQLLAANSGNSQQTVQSLWGVEMPSQFNMYLWQSPSTPGSWEVQSWWNGGDANNMGLTNYYLNNGTQGLWSIHCPGSDPGGAPVITPAPQKILSNGRALINKQSLTFNTKHQGCSSSSISLYPNDVEPKHTPFIPVVDKNSNDTCTTNPAGWLMPCYDDWVFDRYALPTMDELDLLSTNWTNLISGAVNPAQQRSKNWVIGLWDPNHLGNAYMYQATSTPGVFYDQIAPAINNSNNQIITGDFNNDGSWDVATVPLASSSSNAINPMKFYFSSSASQKLESAGQFGWAFAKGDNVDSDAAKLVTGDFNGDGYYDLALINPFGNLRFFILNNEQSKSAINLSVSETYDSSALVGAPGSIDYSSVQIVSGNYNGDDISDLAYIDMNTGKISIYMAVYDKASKSVSFHHNTMLSWIAAEMTMSPANGAQFVSGDFDGNGTSDFAVRDVKTGNFYIRYGEIIKGGSYQFIPYGHTGNLTKGVWHWPGGIQTGQFFTGNFFPSTGD